MMRLISSVSVWFRRRHTSRRAIVGRRAWTKLDAILGARTHRNADERRTRVLTASYSRAPGRTVDWPGAVPSEWRRLHPEYYAD